MCSLSDDGVHVPRNCEDVSKSDAPVFGSEPKHSTPKIPLNFFYECAMPSYSGMLLEEGCSMKNSFI